MMARRGLHADLRALYESLHPATSLTALLSHPPTLLRQIGVAAPVALVSSRGGVCAVSSREDGSCPPPHNLHRAGAPAAQVALLGTEAQPKPKPLKFHPFGTDNQVVLS